MKNRCCNAGKFLPVLFFSFIFSACKFESNRIYFTNNFDDLTVWVDRSTLTDSKSHSGKFSTLVNPSSPYGFSFRAKFRELSDKKIKKARVSFHAFEKDSLSRSSMVFEVRTRQNETVFWRPAKVFEMVAPGKWTLVTQEFDISEEHFRSDDEIRIYPWCQGSSEAFFDDYLLEFYW